MTVVTVDWRRVSRWRVPSATVVKPSGGTCSSVVFSSCPVGAAIAGGRMMVPVGPRGAPVAAERDLLVRMDRRAPGGVVAPAWAVVSLSVVDMIILVQR